MTRAPKVGIGFGPQNGKQCILALSQLTPLASIEMKKLKIASCVALLLVASLVAVVFLNAPKSPLGPFPSPNGYEMLVQAGQQMTPLPLDFDTSQDTASLQTYLDENVDSLALIDQAAGQQFMVPASHAKLNDDMYEAIGSLRGAFRLSMVQARVEQLQGRTAEAADTLAKMAVMGAQCSNGALLVHQQISCAVESLSLESLMQIAPNLDAQQRAEILKMIQSVDDEQDDVDTTIESIMEREAYCAKIRHGKIAGAILIWQTGELDRGDTHTRDAVVRVRTQRSELLEMLRPPTESN